MKKVIIYLTFLFLLPNLFAAGQHDADYRHSYDPTERVIRMSFHTPQGGTKYRLRLYNVYYLDSETKEEKYRKLNGTSYFTDINNLEIYTQFPDNNDRFAYCIDIFGAINDEEEVLLASISPNKDKNMYMYSNNKVKLTDVIALFDPQFSLAELRMYTRLRCQTYSGSVDSETMKIINRKNRVNAIIYKDNKATDSNRISPIKLTAPVGEKMLTIGDTTYLTGDDVTLSWNHMYDYIPRRTQRFQIGSTYTFQRITGYETKWVTVDNGFGTSTNAVTVPQYEDVSYSSNYRLTENNGTTIGQALSFSLGNLTPVIFWKDVSYKNTTNNSVYFKDLSEPYYEIQLQARDFFFNYSPPSKTVKFCFDNEPPGQVEFAIESENQTIGNKLYLLGKNLNISWNAVADSIPKNGKCSGTKEYVINLSGINGFTRSNTVKDISSVFNHTISNINSSPLNLKKLNDGEYTISLKAIDNIGNIGISFTQTFYIDNTPPASPSGLSFSNSFLYNNSLYLNKDTTTTLSWNHNKNGDNTFQKYEVYKYLDGGHWERLAEGLPSPLINKSCDITFTSKEETYKVRAIDFAGNYRDSASITLKRLPDLSAVSFPDPAYILHADKYYLRWNSLSIPDEIKGIQIDHYKVVIKDDTAVLNEADWDKAVIINNDNSSVYRMALNDSHIGLFKVVYIRACTNTFPKTNVYLESETNKTFRLPPLVIVPPIDEDEYILPDDEFWWKGLHRVTCPVVVPKGRTLTIDQAAMVEITSNANISIIVHGTVKVFGSEIDNVRFYPDVNNEGSDWNGIYIDGAGDITGCSIEEAERGLAVIDTNNILLSNSRIINNLVGIHIYNSQPTIENIVIEHNILYGIKEDELVSSSRPVIKNCSFISNGHDDQHHYYHIEKRNITIDELNKLSATNGGNY